LAPSAAKLGAGAGCIRILPKGLFTEAVIPYTRTMISTSKLPDDPALLKAMVVDQVAEIERLKFIIAKLRRMQFGRRSEQGPGEQTALPLEGEVNFLGTEGADSPVEEAPLLAKVSRRRPLPEHLPRETIEHKPAECRCPDCGGELKRLGEAVSEMLEYVPAHFKVLRHVRPKIACTRCDRIVQAEAPTRPIARGIAGPQLLAHVLVGKFCDHLPLYRQSAIYARSGVDLDRSTLADWVGQAGHLLSPLIDALRTYVLSATKVHADDTPMPVLAPGEGRTRTGRLWTYVRDDRPAGSSDPPAVWFAYSPNRKGEHPQRHLRGFAGTLQADAYAGFDVLYSDGRIREAGCWAHVRRKFYELQQAQASPLAGEALRRIGELYAIEARIRGEPARERQRVRQAEAQPRLIDLRAWLESTSRRVSRKSGLAEAIGYALNHWQALERYAGDGAIEIDNNAAERALRAVALGRKNYLFSGADSGGERAAVMYSLIGSAKLNGLDPEAYLSRVLGLIADWPVNRVDELLPWRLATNTEPVREAA